MSLNGLHQFRDADSATSARLLREAQRQSLVMAAVRGVFFGLLFGLIVFLARN